MMRTRKKPDSDGPAFLMSLCIKYDIQAQSRELLQRNATLNFNRDSYPYRDRQEVMDGLLRGIGIVERNGKRGERHYYARDHALACLEIINGKSADATAFVVDDLIRSASELLLKGPGEIRVSHYRDVCAVLYYAANACDTKDLRDKALAALRKLVHDGEERGMLSVVSESAARRAFEPSPPPTAEEVEARQCGWNDEG